MTSNSLNRVIYNYVLVEKDELEKPIKINDVKILSSQDYIKLKEECATNAVAKKQREEKARLEAESIANENARRVALEKANEIRLEEEEAYKKRFSFSKFLTIYNYLKVKSFEGKTNVTGDELDKLLVSVMAKETTIEEAINSHEELRTIFEHMEVN